MSETNEKLIKCSQCGIEKDKKNYYKDKHASSGLKDSECKECKKKKQYVVDTTINNLENLETLYPEKQYMVTGVFGSSKSGKTTFLNYLASKIHKDYDLLILFSSNLHTDNYKFFKEHGLVFDKFNEKVINILHYIQKKTNNKFSFLIFLDDEIDSKFSPVLKSLCTTLRNSKFSTVISLQSHLMMNKISRNNLHRVFFLKLNSTEEILELIQKMLYTSVPVPKSVTLKHAKIDYITKLFIKNTENYNMMVLDNLDNKIYKYKVNFS